MEYPVITFYGEKKILDEVDLVCSLCEKLIFLISHGSQVFLFGNNDDFDRLSAKVLHNLKKFHPNLSSVLVVSPSLQAVSTNLYDQVIALPDGTNKEKYLATKADAIITFSNHPFESSAPLFTHAKDKQIFIV